MKMSINQYNMKKLAAVMMTSACVFVSCVETDELQSGEVGYLAAPMLDVDVTVDDLTPTKALDFEIEAPQVADITFEVKDKDGNVKYSGKGLWSEPLTFPVGSYSIKATYGSNTFGSPYFTGTATGSVDPLESEVPALSLSLANSLVKVTVAESLTGHFTPGETVVFNSGAYEAEYGQWAYVPSGSDITLSLVGKSSTDKDVTFTHTLSAPSPKVAYSVSCGKESTDWPEITISVNPEEAWGSRIYITSQAQFTGSISKENQSAIVYEAIPSSSSDWNNPVKAVTEGGVQVIKELTSDTEYQVRARVGSLVSNVVTVTPKVDGFSATAVHTSTNGELDGTDVTSTFSKPDVVKNDISDWTLSICKTDGTVLRSGLSLGISDGSAITAADGWPYLPAGTYTVSGTYTHADGTVKTINPVTFTSSKPTFSVTSNAYTSYTKYLSSSATAANAVTDDAICDITSASVTISDAIRNNSNYSSINSGFTYALDGTATTSAKVTGQSWGKHTVTASYTFDGVAISGSTDCHVTGLPYSANPPNDSEWDTNEGDAVFESDYVRLGNWSWSNPHSIIKSDFHVPAAINVKVYSEFKIPNAAVDPDYNIYVSGKQVVNYKSQTNDNLLNTSADAQMTNSEVICESSWGSATAHVKVYKLNLSYN